MPEVNKIGRWDFEARGLVLRCGGEERRLEDRAARTLELLCRHRGEVVSKADLINAIWGGRVVSANSVAVVIGDLRRALEDDPRAPVHIVTVNKRGYRLTSEAVVSIAPIPSRVRFGTLTLFAGLIVAGALGLGAKVIGSVRPDVEIVVEPTRNETGDPAFDPLARSLNAVAMDSTAHLPGARLVSAAKSATRRRLVLRSGLILWNGAPELALSAVDATTGATAWSSFAHGSPGALAKSTAANIGSLGRALEKAP